VKALYPKAGISRLRQGIWQGVFLACLGALLAAGSNTIRSSGLPWNGQWSPSTVAASNLQGLQAIPLKEAWSLFQEGKAFFVDARDTLSFQQGHIAGALSVPSGGAETYLEEISIIAQSGHAVIVYCDGEDCPLSPELARTLQKRGVPSVKVLVDGWRLWLEAGHPIEEGGR
jgi:rhodanese-related sulfurtransferase